MSATADFFKNLPPIKDFNEILASGSYQDAPEDWSVVLTDVQGSTKAIEEGRYRDVNMMGAAGLVAIRNLLSDIEVPCVFGGDGATMLVPSAKMPKVQETLQAVQAMSHDLFNLGLRAGSVPVAELHRQGAKVQVARYELTPGNALAQFRGGGLALAEKWIKAGDPRAKSLQPRSDVRADLTGLSCRWQPFRSRKGQIMSLLVLSREEGREDLYLRVVNQIELILGRRLADSNPATPQEMTGTWPSMAIFREARLHSHQRLSLRQLFKAALIQAFALFVVKFNIRMGGFDPRKYRESTALNSDHKKFDDMLRLVIDCSKDEIRQVQTFLDLWRAQGSIFYGSHLSGEALMTCYVQSMEDTGHVHFIDGSDGGYALAAKQLKEQITKSS